MVFREQFPLFLFVLREREDGRKRERMKMVEREKESRKERGNMVERERE